MIPLTRQVTIPQHQEPSESATLARKEIAITAAQNFLIVALIPSLPPNSRTFLIKMLTLSTTTTFYSGYLSLILF